MPTETGDAPEEPITIDDSRELSAWLGAKEHEDQIVRTRLKASERVIARVTDGIYRNPSSALRELISNAWDADANTVTILTDAPRFATIYIRDDGAGMSYETLSRLLHHIGGSAKRQEEGQTLGVTASDDPERTPKGRQLIGKIGIGLFSVSQLARRFKLVTKVAGENYRLVAEIRLRAYSEDGDDDTERESEDKYVTGEVFIKREHTDETDAHGTDVILDDVKPRVRDRLRSDDRWRAVAEREELLAREDYEAAAAIDVEAPKYHSGWIKKPTAGESPIHTRPANLPWKAEDSADVRMRKLIQAVEIEDATSRSRPDLATTLDTYLQSIWALALSAPVEYVDVHPFELTSEAQVRLFWIANERGSGMELALRPGQTVRQAVREQAPGHPELKDGEPDPAGGFKVIIDGVELRRPIRFKFIRADVKGLEHSMLFVGRYNPNLSKIDSGQRGGDLELESYLFWNGRIIPKENNGVLVRIRGASGELFDSTFFKYQVSEQNRLRQITSEIFVQKGVDAALNIDRESFNFAHPHIQLMTIWLHRAVRQLTNRHKETGAEMREQRRAQEAQIIRGKMEERVHRVWTRLRGADPLPMVEIAPDANAARQARARGYVALVGPDVPSLSSSNAADREKRTARATAVVQVLSAYNLLEGLKYSQQQELIDALMQIFEDGPSL